MEANSGVDIKICLKKISLMESMLQELKQGLYSFDKDFSESIKKGEEDILSGRITICKTDKELDNFFDSV